MWCTNAYNEADNLMTQSAKKGGKINPQKSQDWLSRLMGISQTFQMFESSVPVSMLQKITFPTENSSVFLSACTFVPITTHEQPILIYPLFLSLTQPKWRRVHILYMKHLNKSLSKDKIPCDRGIHNITYQGEAKQDFFMMVLYILRTSSIRLCSKTATVTIFLLL